MRMLLGQANTVLGQANTVLGQADTVSTAIVFPKLIAYNGFQLGHISNIKHDSAPNAHMYKCSCVSITQPISDWKAKRLLCLDQDKKPTTI